MKFAVIIICYLEKKRDCSKSVCSHLLGRTRKRWIDSVNNCSKGRGCKEEYLGHSPGNEPRNFCETLQLRIFIAI